MEPPPYAPANLNARAAARYDVHHPTPLILHDPRFYPHPPPPPRHHHRPPTDDDPRLYYTAPPLPRPSHPAEPWDRSAERSGPPEDFRFLDCVPRRAPRPVHRAPPYLPEDIEDGFPSRKRPRWAQDWILEDEAEEVDRRNHKRMEFAAGEVRRRDPFFDPGPPVPLLLPESPPGGLRHGSMDRGRNAFRAPPPPYWSSGHSRADIELVETNRADDRFRDDRFVGNKGKRRMVSSNWYGEDLQRNSRRRSPWKPGVLNRIQSGASVWDRIEEKLPPPSPVHEYGALHGFSEERRPEVDRLDLSYKPTGLVAKVLVPPSPMEPSVEDKVPPTNVPKKKMVKKMVKKKVLKKREKVVVQIVPGSSGSEEKGVTEKPMSSSPLKVPKQLDKEAASSVKTMEDASSRPCHKRVVPSASVGKSSAKRVVKSAPLKKGGVSKVSKNGDIKKSTTKKGIKKCAGVKVYELSRKNESTLQLCQQEVSVVETSTKICPLEQSDVPVDLIKHVSTEEIEEGECTELDSELAQYSLTCLVTGTATMNNSDPHLRTQHVKEGECTALDAELAQYSSTCLVTDTATMNNSDPPLRTQDATEIRASLENHTSHGSKSIAPLENWMIMNPSVEGRADVGDAKKSVLSDSAFTASIPQEPSLGPNGGDQVNQVLAFAVSLISCTGNDFLMGVNEESVRVVEEKERQLEVDTVMEEIETLDGGNSKSIDACLHSKLQDMPVLLPREINSICSNMSSPSGSRVGEVVCFSVPVTDRPSTSDRLRLVTMDDQVVSMIESAGDSVEHPSVFELSEIDSSVGTSAFQDATYQMDTKESLLQLSDGKGCIGGDNSNRKEKQINKDISSLVSNSVMVSEAEQDSNIDKPILNCKTDSEKTLASQRSEKQRTLYLEVKGGEIATRKTIMSARVPTILPNRASMVGSSKQKAHFDARHRTWQRSNTTTSASPSHGNLQLQGGSTSHKKPPKKTMLPNSSYIRKGNSLIRNLVTDAALPHPSHGLSTSTRVDRNATMGTMGLESKVNITDQGNRSSSYIERPKTPPLLLGTKLPKSTIKPSQDASHKMLEDPIYEAGVEAEVGPSESQPIDLICGGVNNDIISGARNSEPSSTRTMIYVKRKSNQLVAASGPVFGDSAVHSKEMPHMLPSFTSRDLYYRRKKNQLIRNALPSKVLYKQDAIIPVDNSNLDDQRVSETSRWKRDATGPFKKKLDKVMRKTQKHSKFSLVWTLSGESPRKGIASLNRWNVLPSIFPWKRTVHQKSSTSTPNKRSLSQISRKLQLTRKRNTIYTVSTDGFSLRKAGLLSIGGSSLKWSKSIERRSKKASEEATLAVAEAERKKRERKRSTVINAHEKRGNRLRRKSAFGIELQQGERIFRIGSARYKMDSSRRTLIRIPEEKSTCAVDQQSENNSQKSFVPRRLLIDNDEYIRVGNGNKLVRDPKKLKRILASEKVRWSLHSVRQRLARKQQYCQFFTRFGTCNKNEGKCPYIHDPTKVAICTKFLRGVCSNSDCKLTHKMDPERMPDCSYFLQGLCTNVNCPYRHVNVNPKASVCKGFLRGYCADGDECQKKHSYVCPVFEASGKCPQGSACRLHHPKSKKKTKEKRTKVQSNSKGRYFGSSIIEASERLIVTADNCEMENGVDLFCHGGQFTDYISLNVGSDDDDAMQTDFAMDSHLTHLDADHADLQPDDLDALIKPLRIMNRASSPSVFEHF